MNQRSLINEFSVFERHIFLQEQGQQIESMIDHEEYGYRVSSVVALRKKWLALLGRI